ncbi:hypothetical protein DL95DRAFT_434543 [Leptodontidium sp. 2 PMI_412]|nr:hypothetical protein DL95DRAFT_434543 [Leptodontidium sp. 2 PMI_412]
MTPPPLLTPTNQPTSPNSSLHQEYPLPLIPRPRHSQVPSTTGSLPQRTLPPHRHLPEAYTLQFIAENTSITVPKVYCAFSRKGRAYIAMERVQGQMLGQGWSNRSLVSQTRLRALQPPEGQGVSNAAGGPIWDCRPHGETMWHGPFKTIHEFHKHLRGGFDAGPNHYPDFSEMITLQDVDWGLPVFTHGDLSSLNILTSGWYPKYWEYTTAKQVSPRNPFWEKGIDKFLEPMSKELGMEKVREKYFNDI